MSLTEQDLKDAYKYGKYANPANSRYNSSTVNVICDRCRKSNLLTCIGYNQIDLCLNCAAQMEETDKKEAVATPPKLMTLMMQYQFKPNNDSNEESSPSNLTFMMQSQFKPEQKPVRHLSRMLQSQFWQ